MAVGCIAVVSDTGRIIGSTGTSRSSCAGRQAEEEVDAVRSADLLLVELVQRAAGHAEDELVAEVADRDGVVAERRARVPERRAGGEPLGCGVMIEQLLPA